MSSLCVAVCQKTEKKYFCSGKYSFSYIKFNVLKTPTDMIFKQPHPHFPMYIYLMSKDTRVSLLKYATTNANTKGKVTDEIESQLKK